MIDENDNFHCDYCGGREGDFYTETGNHVTCQDLVALRARIAALEAVAGDSVSQFDRLIDWVERLAKQAERHTQSSFGALAEAAQTDLRNLTATKNSIVKTRDALAAALDAAKG